jgi:DegV family protein with EDD domain
MSFAIVTDSSANLPVDLIDKYNITVLSLVFISDGQQYRSYEKGKDIDLSEFYKMMREGTVFTTSCVSPQTVVEEVEPLLESGKDVLYIGFSSGLSATYATVRAELEQLARKYPACTVLCVDTLSAALGEGLLVTYAARMREDGKSMREVYDWLEANKLHLCHWFTVDDLKYLKRGGRISAATALVGSVLNIKPVMHMDDEGHLVAADKAIGTRKAISMLVENMKRLYYPGTKQLVYIVHGDCEDTAQLLAAKVRDCFDVEDILIRQVDPVIGAHSGPGTVALFFMGEKR